MKKLIKLLTLLIIICLGNVKSASAQDAVAVKVMMNDGSQNQYLMNGADKIFYSSESMFLASQGNVIELPLAEIRKVLFQSTVSVNEHDENRIAVYPNPVKDKIRLLNIVDNQDVKIYSMDGRLVYQNVISVDDFVNLENLPSGLYILCAGAKITKIVKQ